MPISKMDAEAKLKLLKKQFLKNLPGRVDEIENVVKQIINDHQNIKLYENLMFLCHKLKGVSGTYMVLDAEELANKMEILATKLFNEKTGTLTEEQKNCLVRWVSELHDVSEDSNISELEPIDEDDENNNKEQEKEENQGKIVFLIEPDANISNELITQFDVYNYNTHVVSQLNEMKDHLDIKKDIILVIDTCFLDTAEDIDLIRSYKEEHGNVTMTFISQHGSFELRLKAVRAGADAYFVLPLDVNSLIEKLNSFYTKENRAPYHVLIVDDDVDQVALYAFYLQNKNIITSVVSKPTQVVSQIIETKPELILMDLNMPDCNGIELAKVIRQQEAFVSIPIVFLSSETDSTKQFEALSFGGDDFLTKPIKNQHLVASVSIRVERYRKLRYYMERDSLTGLLNHTRLKERLRAEIERAQRTNKPLSFAMIDLDHFKNVNDTFGHLTGDKVLRGLSNLLKERLRKTDIIGRYGGEEFAVILPETNKEDAFNILNRTRESFSKLKHTTGSVDFFVTLSGGIATYPGISDFSRLNELADQALYDAKNSGRNRIVVHEDK